MDGRHRVAKAALLGQTEITAVQFDDDPEPDYVGVDRTSCLIEGKAERCGGHRARIRTALKQKDGRSLV